MNKKQVIKHYKSHFGLSDIPFRQLGKSDKLMIEWGMSLVKDCPITDVVGRSEQLANFCKKISKQEDCPAEFQEIVNKEFWNLIG